MNFKIKIFQFLSVMKIRLNVVNTGIVALIDIS